MIFARLTRRALPAPAWYPLYDLPPTELMRRARGGDHMAAFVLGDRLETDKCAFRSAHRLYERAAAQGNMFALNNLGSMYQHERGVRRDLATARRYYEAAAKAGSGEAMGNLAWMHREGEGAPQDHALSLKWLKQAVRKGSGGNETGNAMVMLAYAYAEGLGTRRSPLKVLYWNRRAAQAGDGSGFNNLGVAYLQGHIVLKHLSKSVALFCAGANRDSSAAAYMLGLAYERGDRGVVRDLGRALHWYSMADRLGDEDAADCIAALLESCPKLNEEDAADGCGRI